MTSPQPGTPRQVSRAILSTAEDHHDFLACQGCA